MAGALSTILTDPPYGDGVDEAKVRSRGQIAQYHAYRCLLSNQFRQSLTTSSLLLILNSTRSADIPTMIKNLDQVQQDRLMAYLYKGMAVLAQGGEVSGSVLLTWHEKVRFKCWELWLLLLNGYCLLI